MRSCALAAVVALGACTSGRGASPPNTGGAATGGGTAGIGAGGTTGAGGSAGTAGSPGGAGTSGQAGTSGGAGSSGFAGSAGAGADGGAGSSSNTDGSADHGEAAGSVATAGCANHSYQLCIDFEEGLDTNVWSGNAKSIVTTDSAHGSHSFHAYPGGGFLKTTKLGTIKNVVWGRFYVHFKPGAPGGHGEIVGVYDTSGDWYEIGWQFNGILGNWHGLGGEKPLRSKPYLHDEWHCVEFQFDGASGVMPKWWIDGAEAQYYMDVPAAKGPRAETQFTHLEVGMTSFAGLGLTCNDGCEVNVASEGYGNNDPPVMTDLYLDDVAFDTQRIGCIAP